MDWTGQKQEMHNRIWGGGPSWRLPENKGIWEDNIQLNHRKIYDENMNWFHLTQDCVKQFGINGDELAGSFTRE